MMRQLNISMSTHRFVVLFQAEKWPLGETIPSENELVDYFNVSRITIRSASKAAC